MALIVTVQHDSREECASSMARFCADYGLTPTLAPTRSVGTDRWMARATPTAPVEDQGRTVG